MKKKTQIYVFIFVLEFSHLMISHVQKWRDHVVQAFAFFCLASIDFLWFVEMQDDLMTQKNEKKGI